MNMNLYLIAGVILVNLALLAYSTAFTLEEKFKRKIKKITLAILTAGVTFDFLATAFMIAGSSSKSFITLHGILGYIGLCAMIVDCILHWRLFIRQGNDSPISSGLCIFNRIAYGWWIFIYILGIVLVAGK